MLCATIIIFVPLTVLFPDFLRLWINPEFARKGAWVGQLIAFSCIFRGAFIPYFGLLGGLGKPQYISYISIAVGLTSLTVNLILIPMFGLSGAGYAYIVEISWSFAAIVFICRRFLGMASVCATFSRCIITNGAWIACPVRCRNDPDIPERSRLGRFLCFGREYSY